MKFLDIFAGIGGFRSGLELAGHECVGFVELDKFARKSYESMYDTEGEWSHDDITTVNRNKIPRADIWTFGFPCQDISVAGKQTGLEGARSGLFYTVLDIIESQKEENKPSILLIENVKNLLSINSGWDFASILISLDEAGYDAEWEVLNSKNFGVPQNRERVFIVGHLRGRSTRKVFPITRNAGKTTIEIVGSTKGEHQTSFGQRNVVGTCNVNQAEITNKEEGYKIAIPVLTPTRENKRQNGRRFKEDGEPMFTITAQDRHGVAVMQVGNIVKDKGFKNPQRGRIYSPEGLSPTLNCCGGGGQEPKILVSGLYTGQSDRFTGKPMPNISKCLKANKHDAGTLVEDLVENSKPIIRKLTPKECWRLQGFSDTQFDKAREVNSDSQLYKQAGNSVTVNVIYAIGKNIAYLDSQEEEIK